ncbi:MAG: DUF166 domain-containing protein [Methanobacterium sp.]|uniref:DUF166 domain-containing protein n=1 Tax=Methanobacterium sp. TaxID=2164 RepID=UPI003D648431|nr:DUF166 domain-containing protein [Methanobacterium sp.]
MLKVIIVSDGPYGERAYAAIKEEFTCDFIVLEPPTSMFADEIDIPEEYLKKLESADIILSYVLHPDLALDLVDILHNKVDWIIVGAWKGIGFKNQLEGYGNVNCPDNMCNLEENGNPTYDKFTAKFGKPIVELRIENGKVACVEVIRSAPCGSTSFVGEEMTGQRIEDLPMKAGLKLQHYPCRAPKLRLFSDEDCKKEMAATFHKEAFEDALEPLQNQEN